MLNLVSATQFYELTDMLKGKNVIVSHAYMTGARIILYLTKQ